jgi:spore maturation protein CgeB
MLEDLINDDLVESIEKESECHIIPQIYMNKTQKLAFLLGKKFNEIERIHMVKTLSKEYNFYVYGDENWNELDINHIEYKGYAEHFNEMPKIFRCSKVNINYTRIYVESGLPMRIFDVLGSRRFLVTNYKEDIGRYFADGKDLVVYRDIKDLMEIVNYYLNHEEERQIIILNSYENVKNNHTYEIRMKRIMDISKNYFKY